MAVLGLALFVLSFSPGQSDTLCGGWWWVVVMVVAVDLLLSRGLHVDGRVGPGPLRPQFCPGSVGHCVVGSGEDRDLLVVVAVVVVVKAILFLTRGSCPELCSGSVRHTVWWVVGVGGTWWWWSSSSS